MLSADSRSRSDSLSIITVALCNRDYGPPEVRSLPFHTPPLDILESELFGHVKGCFTGAHENKKGLFELANGGSFFIDEIGDFDLKLQSKLLRVIQEKKITVVGQAKEIDVDTRLLFATHCDLSKLISQQKFREDLFYRISTFVLEVPALREHLEDIEIMSNHFLHTFISDNNFKFKEFSNTAIEKLKSYNFPGNVRELISIIKKSALFCENDVIDEDDIQFHQSINHDEFWARVNEMSLSDSRDCFEKKLILKD